MDLSLNQLRDAADIVHRYVPPTAQYAWPLLASAAGCTVWVKHENHTPIGAFKVRGGALYMNELIARQPDCKGVIAATRGNHGQSITVGARGQGLNAVIVVPEGNNPEKNDAMEAQGAELIVHSTDFQAALEHAQDLAVDRKLHMVPSFDTALVRGVASYALELFDTADPLDAVYVPIGLGSGICGVIAVRNALGLSTDVIGVQAEGAPSYARSFEGGYPVSTNSIDTFADGLATHVPVAEAVEIINANAARVVTVTDREILAAQKLLLRATHNLAEPAGAAPLAALLGERDRMAGKTVAVVLSGGNADAENLQMLVDGVSGAGRSA